MSDITAPDVGEAQPAKPRLRVGCQVSLRKRDTHLLAAMHYEGYSPFSQTVSELRSIGAQSSKAARHPCGWPTGSGTAGRSLPAGGGLNLGVDVDVVWDRATAS